MKKTQCKNIADEPILRFLLKHKGVWCNWWPLPYETSVLNAVPADLPPKLVHAKMKMLMRRGLVTGCPCGCRGDFEITPKGEEWLTAITTPVKENQ